MREQNTPDGAVAIYESLVYEVTLEQWSQYSQDWFHQMQKCLDSNGEHLDRQEI